jgi:hypothetical protein
LSPKMTIFYGTAATPNQIVSQNDNFLWHGCHTEPNCLPKWQFSMARLPHRTKVVVLVCFFIHCIRYGAFPYVKPNLANTNSSFWKYFDISYVGWSRVLFSPIKFAFWVMIWQSGKDLPFSAVTKILVVACHDGSVLSLEKIVESFFELCINNNSIRERERGHLQSSSVKPWLMVATHKQIKDTN